MSEEKAYTIVNDVSLKEKEEKIADTKVEESKEEEPITPDVVVGAENASNNVVESATPEEVKEIPLVTEEVPTTNIELPVTNEEPVIPSIPVTPIEIENSNNDFNNSTNTNDSYGQSEFGLNRFNNGEFTSQNSNYDTTPTTDSNNDQQNSFEDVAQAGSLEKIQSTIITLDDLIALKEATKTGIDGVIDESYKPLELLVDLASKADYLLKEAYDGKANNGEWFTASSEWRNKYRGLIEKSKQDKPMNEDYNLPSFGNTSTPIFNDDENKNEFNLTA